MNQENLIISILLQKEDKSFSFKGTAFIISLDGLFLSAAHVFKRGGFTKEHHFCTFPSENSEIYPISFLHTEYIDKIYQKGPVYKDYAIGKIEKKFDDFFIIKNRRPKLGASQRIYGYRNLNTDKNKNIFKLNEQNYLNLSDIKLDPLETEVKNRFALISTNPKDYGISESRIENKKKYNNCFTLRWAAKGGISGGPILNNDDTVSGVYFGNPDSHQICHCTAIKYVRKKIRKHTKYRFNRFKKNKP